MQTWPVNVGSRQNCQDKPLDLPYKCLRFIKGIESFHVVFAQGPVVKFKRASSRPCWHVLHGGGEMTPLRI